jgi:hypothetical protein
MALATRSTEGTGATIGVLYPLYHRPPIMAQKYEYGLVPASAKWLENQVPRIGYAPPLLTEEEGPPN